jgi:hypothetical protein
MDSQVTFAQRPEDGIGNSMSQSVGIGVSFGTKVRRHADTADDEWQPLN